MSFRTLVSAGTRRGLLRFLAALPLVGGLASIRIDKEETAAGQRTRGSHHRHAALAKHKHKKKCATAGQATSKKRKHCCKGLVKGADGRCGGVGGGCDVCASGCLFFSVQAAIDAAKSGDTIRICAGTYTEHIFIDRDLTLIGEGDGANPAADTILHGNESDVVIDVQGFTVTLQDLRITGASVPALGGIVNYGHLTLTGCTVTNNTGDAGGGIYNGVQGNLILDTSDVTNNTTPLDGGGIYNLGMINLVNGSSVRGNTAAHDGGGIFNDLSATLNLVNGSVIGNTADHYGGGILNAGTVTLDASDVTGNRANFGGGIFNHDDGDVALLNGSNVTENTANAAPGSGGGIFNQGKIDPSGGSITDNTPNDCVNIGGGTGCP